MKYEACLVVFLKPYKLMESESKKEKKILAVCWWVVLFFL